MIKYDTFEAYYETLNDSQKDYLTKVKNIIEALPYSNINMSYGVPSFDLKENARYKDRMMVTCYQNHISIYPRKESLDVLKDDIKIYKVLKGTIQIKYTDKFDEELLTKIINHSYEVINK